MVRISYIMSEELLERTIPVDPLLLQFRIHLVWQTILPFVKVPLTR